MKNFLVLFGLVLIAFASSSSTKNDDNGGKIVICHIPPGNPANAHDIEISTHALQAHLDHGDTIGGCEQPN
jgi:hypothetical protein